MSKEKTAFSKLAGDEEQWNHSPVLNINKQQMKTQKTFKMYCFIEYINKKIMTSIVLSHLP